MKWIILATLTMLATAAPVNAEPLDDCRAYNRIRKNVITKAARFNNIKLLSSCAQTKNLPRKTQAVINNNLCGEYNGVNDYKKAIKSCKKAISFNPKHAKIYQNRGNSYQKIGSLKLAIADYNKALTLKKDTISVLLSRGDTLRAQGKLELALADYKTVLSLNAKSALAHASIGRIYRKMKKNSMAIDSFSQAIALNNSKRVISLAAYYRGLILSKEKKWQKAIDDFQLSIKSNPRYISPVAALARIRATNKNSKFRDAKESVKLAKKVISLKGWKNAGYLALLAYSYAATGNFPDAIVTQEKALELLTKDRKMSTNRKQWKKEKYTKQLNLFKENKPWRE